MASKTQPWKALRADASSNTDAPDNALHAAAAPSAIEYGVAKGDIAVVDGTAANVKPAAPLCLQQSATDKAQPWKASWPGAATPGAGSETEYGVAKGDVAVVDGTAANVKPSNKRTVRVVRT